MKVIAVETCRTLEEPIAHAVQTSPANDLTESDGFNPFDFVDLVESIYDRPGDRNYANAVQVQRAEWETLFASCVFAAAGEGTLLGAGLEP